MRLDDERESNNVEDDRGQGSGGFGFGGGGGGGGGGFGGGLVPILFGFVFSRFGCGGVVVLGIVLAVFGGLGSIGSLIGGGGGGAPTQQIGQPQEAGPAATPTGQEDASRRFVRKVLATTEDSWTRILPEQANVRYSDPRLVLFTGQIQSGCGGASSASGPFYCPADRKVYLDTSFFDELASRFGSPGDFAQAYVIAHEIGHHVQKLLGISDQAEETMSRASTRQRNAISVRLELQADCFAGIWAKDNAKLLDPGDVEEAVRAATAIGDDRLQQQSRGTVVPDSFTHGSSAQRVHWLQQGIADGTIAGCDTFRASTI